MAFRHSDAVFGTVVWHVSVLAYTPLLETCVLYPVAVREQSTMPSLTDHRPRACASDAWRMAPLWGLGHTRWLTRLLTHCGPFAYTAAVGAPGIPRPPTPRLRQRRVWVVTSLAVRVVTLSAMALSSLGLPFLSLSSRCAGPNTGTSFLTPRVEITPLPYQNLKISPPYMLLLAHIRLQLLH